MTALHPDVRRVRLDEVEVSPEVWPRSQRDPAREADFVDLYADGGIEAMPLIEVVTDGERLLLAEGHTRYAALEHLGIAEVPVIVVEAPPGADLDDFAHEYALRASAISAAPLTRAEKRRAAARMLVEHSDYADRRIAELVGLSHQTIGRLRQRSNGPVPRDGDDGQEGGTEYLASVTADEIAGRLVRSLGRLWETRGLGDRLLGDRTGRRLAAALHRVHGDDAPVWAERFATWGRVAASELRRSA